jgi:hypothetical protein
MTTSMEHPRPRKKNDIKSYKMLATQDNPWLRNSKERSALTPMKDSTALFLALIVPFLACSSVALAGDAPISKGDEEISSGHGFDWLHPDTAKCENFRQMNAVKLESCSFFPNGNAFALPFPYHKCKAPGGREYLIYTSSDHCSKALETMKSNGP